MDTKDTKVLKIRPSCPWRRLWWTLLATQN